MNAIFIQENAPSDADITIYDEGLRRYIVLVTGLTDAGAVHSYIREVRLVVTGQSTHHVPRLHTSLHMLRACVCMYVRGSAALRRVTRMIRPTGEGTW